MIKNIKKRVDKEFASIVGQIIKEHNLNKISPVISANIKNFLLRKSKKIRPALLCSAYEGYKIRPKTQIYRAACALELLHNFALIHDDIVDDSTERRGGPALHILFGKNTTAKSMAMVAGDLLFPLSIEIFLKLGLSAPEMLGTLKMVMRSAVVTGVGQFLDILYGNSETGQITESDILDMYAMKTADYTFATPLAAGAYLAGRPKKEVEKIFKFGTLIGTAYQIKNDILPIATAAGGTSQPIFSDFNQNKKTIILNHALPKLTKPATAKELNQLISKSASINYAQSLITSLKQKAFALNPFSQMPQSAQTDLITYINSLV